MKTNTIQIITTIVVVTLIAGFCGTEITGDYLMGIAAAVGYLAVAVLVAIAVTDYRGSQRNYTA